MYKVETIEYRGFDINIYNDECPANPVKEWDLFGTMVCCHGRYDLGHESFTNSDDLWQELADVADYEYDGYWASEYRDEIMKALEKVAFVLPLYLYDHSGITMNTGGFSCSWDSGQVGWIYVLKDDVRREQKWKRITKDREAKVYKWLEGAVEVYDHYLTGNVYGYVIEDVDSLWGFYGDHEESGLVDEAKYMIDSHIKNERQSHFDQVKTWIKNNVPLQYRNKLELQ